jgi:hypothetical protein
MRKAINAVYAALYNLNYGNCNGHSGCQQRAAREEGNASRADVLLRRLDQALARDHTH